VTLLSVYLLMLLTSDILRLFASQLD